jgi:outer membrane protein
MKKRKGSIDLGARAIIEKGFLPLTVEATKDVYAGKGYEAMVKIGGVTSHNNKELTVLPIAGIHYQSSKVTDYYYGVRASEVTANRKEYKAGSATTPFLGVEALLNLSANMTVKAGITYEKRAGSVKNSPLTDDKKYDAQGKIGLTYWF